MKLKTLKSALGILLFIIGFAIDYYFVVVIDNPISLFVGLPFIMIGGVLFINN